MTPYMLREIAAARVLVVDFDGTLVRLAVDWAALRADLARRSGVDFSGGLDAGLRAVRERDEALFRKLCDVVAEAEIAGCTDVNRPLLAALYSRREPWAVFSSNTQRAVVHIVAVLRRRAPQRSPCIVVGKEDVRRGKPDPEGLRIIADVLGRVDLFVGDSEHDAAAGEAAGVRTLLVPAWGAA